MNFLDEKIDRLVEEFNSEYRNSLRIKVYVEDEEGLAKCYIKYLDSNGKKQLFVRTFDPMPNIYDKLDKVGLRELKVIETLFLRRYQDIYTVRSMRYYNSEGIVLILIKNIFGFYNLVFYDKKKNLFYDFLNYQDCISFEVFTMFIGFGYWRCSVFYHEYDKKIDSLNKILYSIYISINEFGILPKHFKENECLDYKKLWEENSFFNTVNLTDPKTFRILFDIPDLKNSESNLNRSNLLRNIRKKQYSMMRTKYKIDLLDIRDQFKRFHYVYSTLKVYNEQVDMDKVKITYEKIKDICGQMNSKEINTIFDYLEKNGYLVKTKAKQGHYFKILK